jgi:hypothetical protein
MCMSLYVLTKNASNFTFSRSLPFVNVLDGIVNADAVMTHATFIRTRATLDTSHKPHDLQCVLMVLTDIF